MQAVKDVSFSLEKGEFCSIVGPSGCGKSTVLSAIAGMIPRSGGEIILNGHPVSRVGEGIGYMLQQDNLLEWRTVWQNVLLGLEIRHAKTPEALSRAERLLNTYGLAPFAKRYPAQLSGGMRQRVALIRTLAVAPDILLLDEAFSALDYQTRMAVSRDVFAIIRRERVTTLMVTHDIPEAISMGDRVLVFSPRPAVIQAEIPLSFPAESDTPMQRRALEQFGEYVNAIWKELGKYEKEQGAPGSVC